MNNQKKKILLGIKVSDYAITALVQEKIGDGSASVPLIKEKVFLEVGTVVRGHIKDSDKLAKAFGKIKDILERENINDYKAYFAVPENLVYYLNFKISEDEKKRRELIETEIKRDLPLEFRKIKYEYIIVDEDDEKKEVTVLVVATEKQVYEKWRLFFAKINLPVKSFCLESSANYKALSDDSIESSVMLLDIGYDNSNVSFFKNHKLFFSSTLKYASNGIVKSLNETYPAVEIERNEIFSLWPFAKEVDYYLNFRKALQTIISRVSKELFFIERQYGQKVEELVLLGAITGRPEMIKIFTEELAISVKRGALKIEHQDEVEDFSVPLGLCLLAQDEKNKNKLMFEVETTIFSNKKRARNFFSKAWSLKKMKIYLMIVLAVFFMCFLVFVINKPFQNSSLEPEVVMQELNNGKVVFPVLVSEIKDARWVRARVVEVKVSDATTQARALAEKELINDELLFALPLDTEKSSSVIFPQTIEFLAVERKQLVDFIEQKYDFQLLDSDVLFDLEQYLENYGKQMFYVELSVFSKDNLDVLKGKAVSEDFVQKIRIKNLQQSLNVRAGAGAQNAVVDQAEAGEMLYSLSEKENWLEVLLPSGKIGWLSKQFVDILEN